MGLVEAQRMAADANPMHVCRAYYRQVGRRSKTSAQFVYAQREFLEEGKHQAPSSFLQNTK